MRVVPDIAPVDGWVLMHDLYDHGPDRYPSDWYEAHHPEHGTRLLQTSSYRFTPTQERFAWLVEHGTRQHMVPSEFGYQGVIGVPWDNESIDREIANASAS